MRPSWCQSVTDSLRTEHRAAQVSQSHLLLHCHSPQCGSAIRLYDAREGLRNGRTSCADSVESEFTDELRDRLLFVAVAHGHGVRIWLLFRLLADHSAVELVRVLAGAEETGADSVECAESRENAVRRHYLGRGAVCSGPELVPQPLSSPSIPRSGHNICVQLVFPLLHSPPPPLLRAPNPFQRSHP